MGQYPGMLDTLRARFGVGSNRPELGTAASRNYFQGESETSSAFADRVYVAFARDLGTDTDKRHSEMKLCYAQKFLAGLTYADYSLGKIDKHPQGLASMP